jgi:hypothetical protein
MDLDGFLALLQDAHTLPRETLAATAGALNEFIANTPDCAGAILAILLNPESPDTTVVYALGAFATWRSIHFVDMDQRRLANAFVPALFIERSPAVGSRVLDFFSALCGARVFKPLWLEVLRGLRPEPQSLRIVHRLARFLSPEPIDAELVAAFWSVAGPFIDPTAHPDLLRDALRSLVPVTLRQAFGDPDNGLWDVLQGLCEVVRGVFENPSAAVKLMSAAARAADEIVGYLSVYSCPTALAEWRDATAPLMWAYVVSGDLPAKTVIAILKTLWWCPFTFCVPPDFFGAMVAFCELSEVDAEEYIEQPASFFGTHFTHDFESVPGAALNLARQAGGKLRPEDLIVALDLPRCGESLRVVAQIANRLVNEGLGDRLLTWLGADDPDELFRASLLYLASEGELAGFFEVAGELFSTATSPVAVAIATRYLGEPPDEVNVGLLAQTVVACLAPAPLCMWTALVRDGADIGDEELIVVRDVCIGRIKYEIDPDVVTDDVRLAPEALNCLAAYAERWGDPGEFAELATNAIDGDTEIIAQALDLAAACIRRGSDHSGQLVGFFCEKLGESPGLFADYMLEFVPCFVAFVRGNPGSMSAEIIGAVRALVEAAGNTWDADDVTMYLLAAVAGVVLAADEQSAFEIIDRFIGSGGLLELAGFNLLAAHYTRRTQPQLTPEVAERWVGFVEAARVLVQYDLEMHAAALANIGLRDAAEQIAGEPERFLGDVGALDEDEWKAVTLVQRCIQLETD